MKNSVFPKISCVFHRINYTRGMLTKTQQKVLLFLQQYFAQHKHSPTVAEIAAGIGIKSRGTAYGYLQALVEQGFIRLIPNKRRNIQLVDASFYYLPIAGEIPCKQPIEFTLTHCSSILHEVIKDDRFLCKLTDDSMLEANIHAGDIVICRKANTAENGAIVIVSIDNQETTLRKFKQEQNQITLIPANSTLQSVTYPADRIQIQGVYVGLLRIPT